MLSPEENKYAADHILQYLEESGIICVDDVATEMKKTERKNLLKNHPYPITKGRDGRWRTYVKGGDGRRRQIARSTYEKIEDALVDFYNEESCSVSRQEFTLESLYPSWIEYKRKHNAASTYIKRIDSNWKNWYEGTPIVKIPLIKINKLMLDVWAHELIEKVGHVKKEYYNISIIMRQVLDYAVDAEIISENLFRKVKIDSRQVFNPVKKKPSETQVFTKEEVDCIFEVAWADFHQEHNRVHKLAPLAVMFQFQTGVRLGELCSLKYEDIRDSEIYVNRMFRYETKEIVEYTKAHNEGRFVVLTSEAKKIIDAARKYQEKHGINASGYIFSINEQPLSYYSVRKLYDRYCKMIGTINKSSHKARKTYISALIDGHVNINVIRELVGHSDEQTTFRSYCYDRKNMEERKELIENALS